MYYPFEFDLIPARFIERPNRFLARLRIEGEIIEAHVPDPGRLKELLLPEAEVLVRYHPSPSRKTEYTLTLVRKDEVWVSVNSTLPNRFVHRLLEENRLPEFADYPTISPEVSHGNSRFDFRLENGNGMYWIEVKSVTLVSDHVGLFPDAPTSRGTRHVNHLVELLERGDRAGVLFIVQRPDAEVFAPNWITDPDFSSALKEGHDRGLKITVYTTRVEPAGIALGEKIGYDLANTYELPEI